MTVNSTDPAAPASPGDRTRPSIRFPVTLEGQPALVTGANSGIGRAVALGLAASGADVVVNYVEDPASAEEVVHEIESRGRKAIAIKADVTNEDDVRSMFARSIDHFGTLHIVVDNAGLQRGPACMALHFVNSTTGKLLGERSEADRTQRAA